MVVVEAKSGDRTALLSFKDVSYRYETSNTDVFRHISFDLYEGQTMVLIGPSGSGKTTVLLTAAGLLEPKQGEVMFMSGRLCKRSLHKHIGIVYQDAYLMEGFNLLDNVIIPNSFVPGLAPEVLRANAMQWLIDMDLGAKLYDKVQHLSGGERQRVSIARALARQPKLLIADEPTGHLPPAQSMKVFSKILQMAKDLNMAALIATHNMQLAKLAHIVKEL